MTDSLVLSDLIEGSIRRSGAQEQWKLLIEEQVGTTITLSHVVSLERGEASHAGEEQTLECEILEAKPRGGTGVVLKARTREGAVFALKFLDPEAAPALGLQDLAMRHQLRDEPGLAALHAHGRWSSRLHGADLTFPVLVMEFVDGAPLDEFFSRHRNRSLILAIYIGVEVLRVLKVMHENHVIHGDIKPENVMVEMRDGEPFPRILDLGEARVSLVRYSVVKEIILQSAGGVPVGLHDRPHRITPGYVAPEVLVADAPCTPESDVFSVGVMLWKLATDQLPYGHRLRPTEANRVAFKPSIPSMPGTNDFRVDAARLEQVLLKAVALDPGSRYPTAADLMDALVKCVHRSSAAPTPSSGIKRSGRKKRVLLAALGFGLATIPLAAWLGTEAVQYPGLEKTPCREGDAKACVAEATRLRDAGSGTEASKLFLRACKLGDADACFQAGRLFREGAINYIDPKKAVLGFTRGCDLDHGLSCANLADFVRDGWAGYAKDPKRAAELSKTACDLGSCWGCKAYGNALGAGTSGSPDPATARLMYQRACEVLECEENGDYACKALGDSYRSGPEDQRRPDLALMYYRKACDSTDRDAPEGCLALAEVYWHGALGVAADKNQSMEYLSWGCTKHKDPDSCNVAAYFYWMGIGVPKDRRRALELKQEACNLNDPDACATLRHASHTLAEHEGSASNSGPLVAQSFAADQKACGWAAVAGETEVTEDAAEACWRFGNLALFGSHASPLLAQWFAENMSRLCSEGSLFGCQYNYEIYQAGRSAAPETWSRDYGLQQVFAAMDRSCAAGDAFACIDVALRRRSEGVLSPPAFDARIAKIRDGCVAEPSNCAATLIDIQVWDSDIAALDERRGLQNAACGADLDGCMPGSRPGTVRRRLKRLLPELRSECETAEGAWPLSVELPTNYMQCGRAADTLMLLGSPDAEADVLELRKRACAGGTECARYGAAVMAVDKEAAVELLRAECYWNLDTPACLSLLNAVSIDSEDFGPALTMVRPAWENGGFSVAETALAVRVLDPAVLAQGGDPTRSAWAACEVGNNSSCAVGAYAPRKDQRPDDDSSRRLASDALKSTLTWKCALGEDAACFELAAVGTLLENGAGAASDRWSGELRNRCIRHALGERYEPMACDLLFIAEG